MRGTSTSALIIVAAVVAVVALAGLAVLRMGEAAVGGVSASVSLAEEGGVVTTTIHVLKGALKGVAIRYAMPDGKAWWAKPIYCIAVNNTASVTPTAVYFSKPVPAGQAVTCAFYVWAPSNGMYSLWVLGYRPSGAGSVVFAQSRLQLSANKYQGNLPVGTMTSGTNALSVPIQRSTSQYIIVPVNWRGGILTIQAQWGYTHPGALTWCTGPGDGLYVSFFAPIQYTTDRATWPWIPVGSRPQMYVHTTTWSGAPYYQLTGKIVIGLANSSGWLLWARDSIGLNPSKNWPANTTWTTYVVYNATSNALYVRWVVPSAFDLERTYNLTAFIPGPYSFTPPPPGQYYVVLGFVSGDCTADWTLYSYTIATS